jgi:ABC-type sugar transport system substrate-binding protein
MIPAVAVSPMKKLHFLLSLTNDDNDYQIEQAAAAQRTAAKLGIDLHIVHAGNDGILQSQQLLARIQSSSAPRPDAVILEPAGSTALPHVAQAAAATGIGWVVLNREADYTAELRRLYHVPVFSVTSDHEEIGRIQGRQLMALLPGGGSVLYIQGPSENPAAKQRYLGVLETKPEAAQLRILRARWTEASAHKAVSSWLRLSTARGMQLDAVCAQNDSMAMGARRAFEECGHKQREQWLKAPFLGCDGLPRAGQTWVSRNRLAATVFIPPSADQAIELMMKAIETGMQAAERTFTIAQSIPAVEILAEQAFRARAGSQ